MGTGDQRLEAREKKYHAKMAQQIARKGEVLLDIDDQVDNPRDSGIRYTDLRVKLEVGDGEEVLAIIKRERDGLKEIAFHYGPSVGTVLEGLVGRMKNGSLKWKEDVPYEER